MKKTKRKSRKRLLLLSLMALLIIAAAGIFFAVGAVLTPTIQKETAKLGPSPTPSADTAKLSFAKLIGAPLNPLNLTPFVRDIPQPHGLGLFGGNLFVSSWGENKLFRVDLTTGEKRLLADEVSGAHDMTTDQRDRIVTPLYKANRVVRINQKSGQVTPLAAGLGGPSGIVKSRDGAYYVTNTKAGTVVKINEIGQVRIIAGGLKEPSGIVVDNDNIIRVGQYADPENSVIQVFDNGKVSTVVHGLTHVETLIYDDHKNLLISHSIGGKGALSLFSARGELHQVLLTDLPAPLVGPVTDGKYFYLESAAADQTTIYRIALPE